MAEPWTLRKYRQVSFLLEAGQDIDPHEYPSNATKISDLLRDGVIYPDKKKKYWVDAERDCFAIYARELNITNSDEPKYWQWTTDDSDGVEIATVKKTKWLEVRGSFWTMNLSAGVQYKVSFRTRIDKIEKTEETEKTHLSEMNKKKVNLRLIPPNGKNQEGQKELPGQKSGQDPWYELEVGTFTMTAENVGKMEFLMEASFNSWRAGLVIKGVEIKAV